MRVLLTRPEEDSAPLAALLQAEGVDTLVEPLLNIDYLPGAPLRLAGVQAVLATSANGIRALARRTGERAVPVLAVGDATARTARDLGFASVDSATGDVEALAKLVCRRLRASDGPVLHVAGSSVAGDLARQLNREGFDYRREVLYRAVAARRLTDATSLALAGREVDGVVLYSPRTAATFVRLIGDRGLSPECRQIIAFCLSPAVADRVADLAWRGVVVSPRPEQAAMVTAIIGQKS